MENAPALGENVETQLHLLLSVNRLQVERLIRIHLVADVPVQPSERQLDVEAGVLAAPLLQIVDLVDFGKDAEAAIVGVDSVHKGCLVVLADPNQTLKHVTLLQIDSVAKEVGRVKPLHILMLIVDLDHADQLQISRLYPLILGVRRLHLIQAVNIALVQHSDRLFIMPLNP